jgi:hypothetical protein
MEEGWSEKPQRSDPLPEIGVSLRETGWIDPIRFPARTSYLI